MNETFGRYHCGVLGTTAEYIDAVEMTVRQMKALELFLSAVTIADLPADNCKEIYDAYIKIRDRNRAYGR